MVLAQARGRHQRGQPVPFPRRGGGHRDAPRAALRLVRPRGDEPLADGAGPVLDRDGELAGGPLLTDLAQARELAAAIGYPVMLKSTAGGGGIGMRLCHNEADLTDSFDAVTRMGRANFGGIVKSVCLEYTPDAAKGDYVLVLRSQGEPRDATGPAIFANPQFELFKLKPNLVGAEPSRRLIDPASGANLDF